MRKAPSDPKAIWSVALVVDEARDPAIDEVETPGAALLEYLQCRDSEMIGSEVLVKEGERVTWWKLAPLSFAFMSEVVAREPSAEKRRELAVRAALVGVDGPLGEHVNLTSREGSFGKMSLLALSELEHLAQAIGYAGVHELGDVALVRARLAPGRNGPFGLCR
jgi:hypothetical protein